MSSARQWAARSPGNSALSRPDLMRSLQIVCSWPETDPWLAELISAMEVDVLRHGRVRLGKKHLALGLHPSLVP